MKEFYPIIQTILGGLLTLLGVYVVQRKSDTRDQKELIREVTQECYENLLTMESCYIDESMTYYQGVKKRNLKMLRNSTSGNRGNSAGNKAIAAIELYFPKLEYLADDLRKAETNIMNFHSSVMDDFETITLKKFSKKSDKLYDKLSNAIFELKYALTDTMQEHIKL